MTAPVLPVVGAAIVRQGRCLIARRGPAMALAGKWEFVGGKVEPGEEPQEALRREVREELGLEIAVGEPLGVGIAPLGSGVGTVELTVHLATIVGGELALAEHAEARWIAAGEIAGLDWAAADLPVLPALVRALAAMRDAPGSDPE